MKRGEGQRARSLNRPARARHTRKAVGDIVVVFVGAATALVGYVPLQKACFSFDAGSDESSPL